MTDDDPFALLGVAVTASVRDVEREAQKLLAMLALGVGDAGSYDGPDGPRPRTAEAVRAAAARLRDPRQRLLAEVLAGVPTVTAPSVAAEAPSSGWPEALRRTGWGPR